MRNRIAKPQFDELESKAISRVLQGGWVGPNGPEVALFENQLSEFLGPEHKVLATVSGTAALHLALLTRNIGPGDFVITPSLAYAAAAFAIRYVGAEPVFIGAETNSWNMDLNDLEKAIKTIISNGKQDRLKAILPVHNYGLPSAMREINAIADKYNLIIIEDAAESLGSSYSGRPAGTLGHFGVFSFNANKIVSTGGGGALICKDEKDFQQAKSLANQAKVSSRYYRHSQIGYNYTMNSVAAALGVIQFKKLASFIKARADLRTQYEKELSGLMTFQGAMGYCQANNWIVAAILKQDIPDSIYKSNTIELKPIFSPLHEQAPFKGSEFFGSSNSMMRFERGIMLPSGGDVYVEEVVAELKSHLL